MNDDAGRDIGYRERAVRTIVDTAMAYVARGWRVIPVAAGGRKPLVGERCVRDAALPEREQIERWWRTWPYASVGLLTGEASGLIVVSEPRARGLHRASVGPADDTGHSIPRTACTRHAWNRHHFFATPSAPVPSRGIGHLRVYGERGVVVVPPASMLLALPVWEVPPFSDPLAAAPEWLFN